MWLAAAALFLGGRGRWRVRILPSAAPKTGFFVVHAPAGGDAATARHLLEQAGRTPSMLALLAVSFPISGPVGRATHVRTRHVQCVQSHQPQKKEQHVGHSRARPARLEERALVPVRE